jgi:hypothetical protein
VRDVDFVLINNSVWIKLLNKFGGAPMIAIFLVNKNATDESPAISEEPDLNPVKVMVRALEFWREERVLGVLVSPYIGAKVFNNFISEFFSFPPTKTYLHLVDAENLLTEEPIIEIKTKGTCTKRLIDYGISDNSLIYIK